MNRILMDINNVCFLLNTYNINKNGNDTQECVPAYAIFRVVALSRCEEAAVNICVLC